VDGSIRHNCQFKGDTFRDAQPVKDERWGKYSDGRILKISRAAAF